MSTAGRVYDNSPIDYMKGHMAMTIKHRNNKLLGRLSKGVRELESAFGQLAKAVPYDASKDATRLYPISAFIVQLKKIRICASRLQKAGNRSGRIDSLGAGQLSFVYESLKFALRPMGELRTAHGGPLSVHPLFARVREEVNKLGESEGLVTRALDQQAEADMEHSPDYENPRKLRQAIKTRNRRLGKNLGLKYLDQWVGVFTGINWQDGKMVDRVANIFILYKIPDQTWELRYKPKSPGAPLVLVHEMIFLPEPDFLEVHGLPPGEYYIAAKLPSWRIVWKMSWYSQN